MLLSPRVPSILLYTPPCPMHNRLYPNCTTSVQTSSHSIARTPRYIHSDALVFDSARPAVPLSRSGACRTARGHNMDAPWPLPRLADSFLYTVRLYCAAASRWCRKHTHSWLRAWKGLARPHRSLPHSSPANCRLRADQFDESKRHPASAQRHLSSMSSCVSHPLLRHCWSWASVGSSCQPSGSTHPAAVHSALSYTEVGVG